MRRGWAGGISLRTGLLGVLLLISMKVGVGWMSPVSAQAPPAHFTYLAYPAGWNLVSFGAATSVTQDAARSTITGALYSFQPGDTAYSTTDLDHVVAGRAYWAFFSHQTAFALSLGRTSAQLSLPAGGCALVGNPSVRASARVSGASRVYVYSAVLQSYTSEMLVGIGRGAWACNDGQQSANVSVADQGAVLGANWPDCCGPAPYVGNGKGLLVFRNDSPAPLIVALRQTDASGALLGGGAVFDDVLANCSDCPEYSNHETCNSDAVTHSVPVPPGTYTLHLQSEGANVPDLLADITVQADTSYGVCFYIGADRAQ